MNNPREIIINGVTFTEREGYPQPFRFDYIGIIEAIHNRKDVIKEKGGSVDRELIEAYKFLILNDLWFILAFVMKIPMDMIYRDFVIQSCKEVEDGPDGWCIDLWSRGHFKTSIKTKARTLQEILKYPEECTMIGSHTRPTAKQKFMRPIKELCETSQFLKDLFPAVLYQNPKIESPKWSLDINTPILTTEGFKKHGDLQVGDEVFGSEGQIISVTGNSGVIKNANCRRIIFDDCEIIASSEHLWPVQYKESTPGVWPVNPEIKIITTDELPIKERMRRLPPTPIVKFKNSNLRKLNYCKGKRHKVGRYIRSIEKIDSIPVNCIKVNAKDSLYLAGESLVPTHNSEDDGLIFKGHNPARGEATLEAHGVKEGMPIGSHYNRIKLEDLETPSDVKNPDVIQHGRDAVDKCLFLLTEGGSIDITGTPYSHLGIYIPHIVEKKKGDGSARYLYRRKPATKDGTKDGEPVMLTKEALDNIYAELAKDGYGEYSFNTQMLIDPTPKGTQQLNSSLMMDVEPKYIPDNLVKFMVIDPAGDASENRHKGDDWAVWIIGVEVEADAEGIHKRYLLDGFGDILTESAAPELLGRIYMRHTAIRQVGYEFRGIAPAWVQNFCEYVRKSGGVLYEDPKMNMVVRLKDGGRQKATRIVSAIGRPLEKRALFMSTAVPDQVNRKAREEMDKFGFWPDNLLDAMAYLDDILRTYDLSIHKTRKGNYKEDEKNNEYDPFESVSEGR